MAEAGEGCTLLVRGLGVRRGTRVVLQRVDFDARAGEVLAILGPNGAGKTTLLRAILGLDEGVEREGVVSLRCGDEEVSLAELAPRARARRVAYVPQRSLLRAALSVEDVVLQGRFAHGSAFRPSRAERTRDAAKVMDALRAVDAADFVGRRFTQLSVGEQQRVLIARALASEAGVILLDEPTAALDVAHSLQIHALVRRLRDEGRTLVMVMHGLDDARKLAGRAVLLHRGGVHAQGPVREVVASEPVREVYGVRLVEDVSLGFERVEP